MAPQKRKDKPIVLLKSLVLVILCLSFGGMLSCNWGSGSTNSGGGGGGTGTGWTITIQVGTNPLALTDTTTIVAIVRDSTGARAPLGTYVCMTSLKNSFLLPGSTTPFASVCENTSNNLGQSIHTYYANFATGDDIVEVSSQGVIATTTITVN